MGLFSRLKGLKSEALQQEGHGLIRHCLIRIIHEWTVFLAKLRIQGNWPSQTASLPARPPMQGVGYGPRHTAIENTVLAVDDNAVTCYQQ